MMSLIFFLVVAGVLFALAYITKRRLGVLGLALAAGSVLSAHWADTLTPFIEQQGVVLVAPPLESIVEALLILAPPLILLLSGPTYSKPWPRFLGALGFTVLTLSFLLAPLGTALRLEGPGANIFNVLASYQSLLIVIGLAAAIVDVALTRKTGSHKSHGKKGDH